MWAMSPAIALSLQLDMPWRPGPAGRRPGPPNPLVGTYLTQDGRFLAFSCLQGFRYWPSACRVIGREELITDERFTSHEQLAANAGDARAILKETFESAPLERVAGAPRRLRGPVGGGAGQPGGRRRMSRSWPTATWARPTSRGRARSRW